MFPKQKDLPRYRWTYVKKNQSDSFPVTQNFFFLHAQVASFYVDTIISAFVCLVCHPLPPPPLFLIIITDIFHRCIMSLLDCLADRNDSLLSIDINDVILP